MLNSVFSSEGFDHNDVQQCYTCHSLFDDEYITKQDHFFVQEDAGDDLWSSYEFFQEASLEKGLALASGDPGYFSELVAAVSPPIQAFQNPTVFEDNAAKSMEFELSELLNQKEKSCQQSIQSLHLLNNYKPSLHWLNEETPNKVTDNERRSSLTTEEIMRMAAARYIELSVNGKGNTSAVNFGCCHLLSGFSIEEIQNIDLVSLLLAAATEVSNKQYGQANNLLRRCCMLSPFTGNPVQRIVYYFSYALQERIDRETGRLSPNEKRERSLPAQAVVQAMLASHPVQLLIFKKLALPQLTQLTSMQAILDDIASEKRIHMIDLSIKHGIQWTIMMQSLATRSACPIEYLKISAVGTSEEAICETGQRLIEFAETLCLRFYFKAVILSDMNNLRADMFMFDEEEAIGIYSNMGMNSMIVRQDRLENVMRVIRKIRPRIMTVVDSECNQNSQYFIKRFTESLFYFSALFDCLYCCMDREDDDRLLLEGHIFAEGIRNIVATEGSERVVRHVGLSVWRSYFKRFGLVEADLNEWSQYQASLLVKQFAHSSSWSLDKEGKSLTIGWKGTPLQFISAWKFH